jgi:hypothetical protein
MTFSIYFAELKRLSCAAFQFRQNDRNLVLILRFLEVTGWALVNLLSSREIGSVSSDTSSLTKKRNLIHHLLG